MVTFCKGGAIAFESEGEMAMLSLGETINRFNKGDQLATLHLLLFALVEAQVKQTAMIQESMANAAAQAPDFDSVIKQAALGLPGIMKMVRDASGETGATQVSHTHHPKAGDSNGEGGAA